MTNIQERSSALLMRIAEEHYFLAKLAVIVDMAHMTVDGIKDGMYDDVALVVMWNNFWMALPDDKSCRREPFFELCDLCEEVFNEPDNYDED